MREKDGNEWCCNELGILVHASIQTSLQSCVNSESLARLQTANSSYFFLYCSPPRCVLFFFVFFLCARSGHIVLSVADARVIGWMATGPAAGLEGEPVFSFFFFFSLWTLCSLWTAHARLFQSCTLLSTAYRSSCPIHLCNSLFIAFPCYYIVIRLSPVQYFIVFYCAACPPPKSSAIQPRCFSPNKPV